MDGLRWFRWGDETSKINAIEENQWVEQERERESEWEQEREGEETVRGFLMTQMISVFTVHTGVHVCARVWQSVCMCVCVSHCRFSRRRRPNNDVIDFFSHELHFVAAAATASARSLCRPLPLLPHRWWWQLGNDVIVLHFGSRKNSRAECTR